MTSLTVRAAYVTLAFISFGLIGAALLLQHLVGLDPCPLCIFQRIAYLALALFALIAAWLSPRTASRWFGVLVLFRANGVGIAGCTCVADESARRVVRPGLEAMSWRISVTEVLPKVFRGQRRLFRIHLDLLGLTIVIGPIWFVLLSAARSCLFRAAIGPVKT